MLYILYYSSSYANTVYLYIYVSGTPCKLLLDFGADVNKITRGSTPLMYACRNHLVDQVRFLLEYDADIYIKDDKGLTVLDYADSYINPIRNMILEAKQKEPFVLK